MIPIQKYLIIQLLNYIYKRGRFPPTGVEKRDAAGEAGESQGAG